MANYILLMTLTPEGRERLLRDPSVVSDAAGEVREPEVTALGMYGVLGPYDFVTIVEAPDNESVARYSIKLGVRAGVHITTLPAVPITLLQDRDDVDVPRAAAGAEAIPPDDR